MKKIWLWIVIMAFGLCLSPKSLPAENLNAGKAALFLQGGKMVIGEIADLSRTRLVFTLRDGQEFELNRIWMINFVNTDWNFPAEREKMEKDQHYLVFRNDRMTSGKIIDFSHNQGFQFDTKEAVPLAQVRRIYFTNQLPPAYQSRLEDVSGKAALFMRGGRMIVGEVVDISSTRLVLQLKDGQEFPLNQIWMVNFVNTDWNFPEERKRLEKNEHYLFFNNDRITAGRITDFSSTRRVFQFDTKEEVPIAQVRRIYFTNQLPPAYQSRLAEEETGQRSGYVGTFRGEIPLSSGVARVVTLILNEDRTALLLQQYPQGKMPITEQGSWSDNPDGTITVQTSGQGQIRRLQTVPLVLRLENNDLIAVKFDQNIWGSGGLRLKRT